MKLTLVMAMASVPPDDVSLANATLDDVLLANVLFVDVIFESALPHEGTIDMAASSAKTISININGFFIYILPVITQDLSRYG
ncbi:MAG TPA: hypothetical protein VN455_13820, partial [Methanotrichaceae archaeon]|nr:hypothetical protein [Methanotrichaceae archaeon]